MDILQRFRPYAYLIIGSLLFSACVSTKPKAVEFEVIPTQFQFAYQEYGPKIFILKNEDDLKKAMTFLKMEAPEGLPDLSFYFPQHTVVLLYAGMQRSSGFMFGAEAVQVKKQSVTITARLLQPASDCMVSAVITYPMQLIAIEHVGGTDFNLDLVNAIRPCR
ncbi:MAG: protease complex subunit PrcB family protein [Sphingobacteriaceae bacterium]|nr:protease complex subunit PrcB family protein [Sphingobacteriaceae bacterium]